MPGLENITVILVSYDSGAVIGRAVASVPPQVPVIIVDNASPEGTASWKGCPAKPGSCPCHAIWGSATACNAGAQAAATRYVMFLNPDAVLEHGSLDRFWTRRSSTVRRPCHAGDCRRQWSPHAQGRFHSGARAARPSSAGGGDSGDYCTRFVHGAAVLVERELFLAMGGFDERIFLYHEDDDLARALQRKLPIIWPVPPACGTACGKSQHAGRASLAPSPSTAEEASEHICAANTDPVAYGGCRGARRRMRARGPHAGFPPGRNSRWQAPGRLRTGKTDVQALRKAMRLPI